tara:strand:+ start:591 stop:857 length:267 start_codon:yes stop_codon:yes gene_type:complete
MLKNKWKIVSDTLCDDIYCQDCQYSERGWNPETGGWRECWLLNEGTDPEYCLGYDKGNEQLETKIKEKILSLPEASEVHQVLTKILED